MGAGVRQSTAALASTRVAHEVSSRRWRGQVIWWVIAGSRDGNCVQVKWHGACVWSGQLVIPQHLLSTSRYLLKGQLGPGQLVKYLLRHFNVALAARLPAPA